MDGGAFEQKEFLTVNNLAARYGINLTTAYEWIAQKRLPESVVLRLGRKILINRKNLEAFEAKGRRRRSSSRSL